MMEFLPQDTGFMIGANVSANINSTAFTDQFLYGFLDGRKLSNSDKDNMIDRTASQNRFGLQSTSQLFVAKKITNSKVKNWLHSTFYLKVADRQILNLEFADNLLKLGLYGNRQFAGQNVDLGNFDLNFFRFQQIQLGWIQETTERTYGIGISYLNGERQLNIDSDELTLYTSELGDVANIQTKLEAYQSDTSNNNFLANNGNGASIDLFYEHKFCFEHNEKAWDVTARLDISDVGFISWNDRSTHYDIDSSYNYIGTEVEDLFDLGDSILNFVTPDSIYDALTTRTKKKSHTTYLPPTVHSSLTFGNGIWNYTFGTIFKINANYYPYGYFRPIRNINRYIRAGGSIGYGGYGTFSYGLEAYFNYKKFQLGIGSKHLEGVTLPNRSGGNQLFVTLKTTF